MNQIQSRRSRRLAGLPPVAPDEGDAPPTQEQEERRQFKVENLTVVQGGLIYTDGIPFEYVWIAITILFFILPIYLFLAKS